jgi:hypothetical protein
MKQSSFVIQAGLLRCTRNDGWVGAFAVFSPLTHSVIACDKREAFALGAKRRSNPACRDGGKLLRHRPM